MGAVSVNIGSDLAKMAKAIDAKSKRVSVEIARGLNEGGDKVRTQVRRAMRAQTGLVKLESVTKRQRTVRAFEGSLNYAIVVSGKPPTKPSEFRVRVSPGPGGGVTIWMWNRAHKFKRSFKQKMLGGLRMRLGAAREPIRGFDGPNLAKEAVKGDVARTFVSDAATVVPATIVKRLGRL